MQATSKCRSSPTATATMNGETVQSDIQPFSKHEHQGAQRRPQLPSRITLKPHITWLS